MSDLGDCTKNKNCETKKLEAAKILFIVLLNQIFHENIIEKID